MLDLVENTEDRVSHDAAKIFPKRVNAFSWILALLDVYKPYCPFLRHNL